MNSKDIQSFIFDMDGVLWRGPQTLGDPAAIFSLIQSAGKSYAFATNNSTRHISGYAEKLTELGIPTTPDQIFTSAKATALVMAERYPHGGNLFIIGEDGLEQSLADHHFSSSAGAPLAVVAGLDRQLSYTKLAQAAFFIQNGVPFIGTNPDVSFPTPTGVAPGAGSILALLQATTGISPEIIGKPQPTIFTQALEFLGTSPAQTLVVGDRLDTDIAGGIAAGCPTALLLSGVTGKAQIQPTSPKPDMIETDLTSLIEGLLK